ncbi:MAG: hypothetical protein LBH98_09785 [Chitinispirillales bacterium]|nr:hypothetical protein [Chitinispirillales bacterium]
MKPENEMFFVILLGLSVILQLISLIKITQFQNSQKHRESKNNSVNDGRNRAQQNNQNPNKKNQGNNISQNNRPSQQNGQRTQPQNIEKKFERIVSNAQSLKDTNSQLGNRSKDNKNINQPNQPQNKPKVYSERPAVQKQERPANVPIKQAETVEQKKPEAVFTESANNGVKANLETKTESAMDVKTQQQSGSVQYGRR